jgi:hypothetical protein
MIERELPWHNDVPWRTKVKVKSSSSLHEVPRLVVDRFARQRGDRLEK